MATHPLRRSVSDSRGTAIALLAVAAVALAPGLAFADGDSDLVPDAFDNCLQVPNGPGDPSNQVDSDVDGYGNVCDFDYNGDFLTTTLDFSTFFAVFVGDIVAPETDHDGDGATTTSDFPMFMYAWYGMIPSAGPSGLPCAGSVPCLP